jgi:signal transduction histidine kinase
VEEAGGAQRRGRYLVAVACILIAVLIRAVMGGSLGDRVMYVTFWPAVMVSSWYGGLGPGLLTALGSALLIQLLWVQLSGTFMRGFPDAVAQLAFIGLAVVISILNDQRLRAIERANAQERLAKERSDSLQQEMKERKALEDDLIQMNRDLGRSNEDLAGFAHMISHDLQEPLRTMILYSELLKRRYAEKLEAEGVEWLDFIASSGARLTGMIRNLLEYAKAGKSVKASLKQVQLNDLVVLVEKNLSDLLGQTGAKLAVSELPSIRGDDLQLLQVFQNLITNAVKYRKKDVAPEVRITAQSSDTHWIVHVSDNGMGVDPSQTERIFKPFVRGTAQSDGSGIGLATCRRIVERHGGDIWVESESGQGATFSFSLAKNLDQLQ